MTRDPTGVADWKQKVRWKRAGDLTNRNYAEECRKAATDVLVDMERCLVASGKLRDVNEQAIRAQLFQVRIELKDRKGKPQCRAEGCERAVWCAGLCTMHYHRERES